MESYYKEKIVIGTEACRCILPVICLRMFLARVELQGSECSGIQRLC